MVGVQRKKVPMSWREYVQQVARADRQVEISARTGIDQGTISRWMKGTHSPTASPRSVRLFALGYGRPILEAFVVAGLLTEEEAGMSHPTEIGLSEISTAELAAEVARRLVINGNAKTAPT